MTDTEFAEELATRLNLLLEADGPRANMVLLTPLVSAGYANVGHFVTQLALPRHLTKDVSAEELQDVKFITPKVENRGIIGFEALSGKQLQESLTKLAKGT